MCGLLVLGGCKGFSFKKSDGPAPGESEKDRAKREGAEEAFLAECTKLGELGETVAGKDGYYFSAAELKRLGATPAVGSGTFSNVIGCIADYRQQLKKAGVDLVVAVVPTKAVLYADKVSKEVKVPVKKNKPARMDSYYLAVAEALDKKGLRVVDLTETFLRIVRPKAAAFIRPAAARGLRWRRNWRPRP